MEHQKILKKFLPNLLILATILIFSTTWTIAQEVGKQDQYYIFPLIFVYISFLLLYNFSDLIYIYLCRGWAWIWLHKR